LTIDVAATVADHSSNSGRAPKTQIRTPAADD
jgi:hypothetical protein